MREGDPAISEDGVHVEVELEDGRVLVKELDRSLGNLDRLMNDEQLSTKFRDQAVRILPEDRSKRSLRNAGRRTGSRMSTEIS
ncbi:hypothetical protein HNS03_16215 [Amorphus sp. 3PC139-8]